MSADPDERFNETCPPVSEETRFPLTCSWCSSSPATHLAVADWRFKDGPQRLEHMLCATCAHGVTVLPGEVIGWWWLFRLVPDDTRECDVPATDEDAATAAEGNGHD